MSESQAHTKGIEAEVADLKQQVGDVRVGMEAIKATLDTLKWGAGIAVAIITAVLSTGAYEYLTVRSEARKAIADGEYALAKATEAQKKADAISHIYAEVSQNTLLNSIESALSEQSLDSLRQNRPALENVRRLGAKLQELGAKVDDSSRTSFGFVLEALDSYINEDYGTAITALDKVRPKDREHFIYWQMRGICLHRLGKQGEAAQAFATAGKLAVGRSHSIAANGQGGAKLYEWKTSREPEKLKEAIAIFEQLTMLDPTFPTAYFNLAVSLAQLGPKQYGKVTEELTVPDKKGIRSLAEVAALVVEDLERPSDRLLKNYVRDYLRVTPPYTADKIAVALANARRH